MGLPASYTIHSMWQNIIFLVLREKHCCLRAFLGCVATTPAISFPKRCFALPVWEEWVLQRGVEGWLLYWGNFSYFKVITTCQEVSVAESTIQQYYLSQYPLLHIGESSLPSALVLLSMMAIYSQVPPAHTQTLHRKDSLSSSLNNVL